MYFCSSGTNIRLSEQVTPRRDLTTASGETRDALAGDNDIDHIWAGSDGTGAAITDWFPRLNIVQESSGQSHRVAISPPPPFSARHARRGSAFPCDSLYGGLQVLGVQGVQEHRGDSVLAVEDDC